MLRLIKNIKTNDEIVKITSDIKKVNQTLSTEIIVLGYYNRIDGVKYFYPDTFDKSSYNKKHELFSGEYSKMYFFEEYFIDNRTKSIANRSFLNLFNNEISKFEVYYYINKQSEFTIHKNTYYYLEGDDKEFVFYYSNEVVPYEEILPMMQLSGFRKLGFSTFIINYNKEQSNFQYVDLNIERHLDLDRDRFDEYNYLIWHLSNKELFNVESESLMDLVNLTHNTIQDLTIFIEKKNKNTTNSYFKLHLTNINNDNDNQFFTIIGTLYDISDIMTNMNKIIDSSKRDYLTNNLNRNALYETNLSSIGSLFFIDLDNLKNTNDKYGHRAGDRLLIEFSKVVKSILSKTSRLYRIAGDEFAITSLETNKEVLDEIIEKYNKYSSTFIYRGNELVIEFSLGYAINKDFNTIDELIESADKEMYKYKQQKKMNK